MIPTEILNDFKAVIKSYAKDQLIFNELDPANFYFQILKGHVKMFNQTEDGKEFVQGFFKDGKSFGEPPLFSDSNYPASAVCLEDSEVFVLPKKAFFKLLKTHDNIHLSFTKLICKRMLYKAKIIQEVSIHPPDHRILTLLNHLKENSKSEGLYEVTLTRQQISDLTGLRVETVIRTIKQLEKSNKLSIKQHKVYL